MNKSRHVSPGLLALARLEVETAGFAIDFPDELIAEAVAASSIPLPEMADTARDMRELLWSSIDNEESRDLDQVEFAESLPGGEIRLLIGIADVDQFVPKGSGIDLYAASNTVSVYTPVAIFPMLPVQLSTGATSLLEGEGRLAVVIELIVAEGGEIVSKDVYRAIVRNQAKLNYDSVGKWLEDEQAMPSKLKSVPGLAAQLKLQLEATTRLHTLRRQNGALEFDRVEADAVTTNGNVTDVVVRKSNRAREIIENFMIAANTQMADFLEERDVPSLRRVVRTPERWPRIVELAAGLGHQLPASPNARALSLFLEIQKQTDPAHFPDLSLAVMKLMGPGEYRVESPGVQHEGHFGLAVNDYTHSTAPNRRYPDLITQRLVKGILRNESAPYTIEELEVIAEHCTRMEDAARKIERTTLKAAIATILSKRVGEEFEAIVTGVKSKGTFVRITDPPAEGMLVQGARGLDVGDRIRVRLVSTDPEHGFIDFARL